MMQVRFWSIVFFCFSKCFLFEVTSFAQEQKLSLSSTIQNEVESYLDKFPKIKLGVVVFDLGNDEIIFEHQAKTPLKPASVLKILTSVAALNFLGPEYKFYTEVYTGDLKLGKVDKLYIKGGGDPGFVIESAWLLARKIKARGIEQVGELWVDNSSFVGGLAREGQRAYQAGVSAVSFNYNSLTFEICPVEVGQKALVTLDPWEVPVKLKGSVITSQNSSDGISLRELGEADAARFPLQYQINGNVNKNEDCVLMYRSVLHPEHMFGHTFLEILKQVGIKAPKNVNFGPPPAQATLFYKYPSQSLSKIVYDLNHFSNNLIAEQLLFALGYDGSDRKFYRNKGLDVLSKFLSDLGGDKEEFSLFDASGLSHSNHISASLVTELLKFTHSNPHISPEFKNSLSVAKESGTLKKREFQTIAQEDTQPRSYNRFSGIIRGKTGSIDGVSALAGYAISSSGQNYAFAILQNNIHSREKAVSFEDQIMGILAQ